MTYLLQLLKLATLAGVTVSLWTVRVALTAHGRRYAGAFVATAEAITFATVFAQVLASVDSPTRLAAYGLGVGGGTLAGLSIDRRLTPATCTHDAPDGSRDRPSTIAHHRYGTAEPDHPPRYRRSCRTPSGSAPLRTGDSRRATSSNTQRPSGREGARS